MRGYLFDTSVISALLDRRHDHHFKIRQAVAKLDPAAPQYLSPMSLAETEFGSFMAAAFQRTDAQRLKRVVREAKKYGVLPVSRNTAPVYARLKTDLAKCYLAKASRKDRPRWVEDWVDKTTGEKLQIEENDLWMCAQAKERDLILVTVDDKMKKRVSKADRSVRFRVL